MFICTCDKLTLAGGRVARNGDKVPEAAAWPENIQRAHLRMGYLKKDPDYKAPAVALDAAGVPPAKPAAAISAAAVSSPIVAEEAPPAENRYGNKKKNRR